jgi:hypothetical protein
MPLASDWTTSSYSESSSCVEAQLNGDVVQLRNSQSPDKGVITFTLVDWSAVLKHVRQDESDFTIGGMEFKLMTPNRWVVRRPGITLCFNRAEREAFVAGVKTGQFNLPAAA